MFLVIRSLVRNPSPPADSISDKPKTQQQGLSNAGVNAMVAGTVADLFESQERGFAMNLFTFMVFLGQVGAAPCCGSGILLTSPTGSRSDHQWLDTEKLRVAVDIRGVFCIHPRKLRRLLASGIRNYHLGYLPVEYPRSP